MSEQLAVEENTVRPSPVAGRTGRPIGLCCTVFLTGVSTLVLEILGTRLLSPYFGNNVFVWTSLISVTLIALALGYWVGGKAADRRGGPSLLDQIIAAAAVWIILIPLLVRIYGAPLANFTFQVGLLLTAFVSFGPPLFLLGMVTPVAVQLFTVDLGHIGRSSGTVYAWSTAGGILGALGSGFFLFPLLPVSHICYVTGLTLLALVGTRWLLRSGKRWLAFGPAALLAVVFLTASNFFLAHQQWSDGPYHVIANRPSFYGTVRVVDLDQTRVLSIDGMCHNAFFKSDGKPALSHLYTFAALPYMRPSGSRLLLIGMGGGGIIRLLHSSRIEITAVEIEPVVAEVAFSKFNLDHRNVRLVIADGRSYLRRCGDKFDFVALDAFCGGTPPAHLFSREAFQEMKDHLSPGGVLAINITVKEREGPLLSDLVQTLASVFKHQLALTADAGSQAISNVVLFASDGALEVSEEWARSEPDPVLALHLENLPNQILDLDSLHGHLITDDFNRMDLYSAPVEISLRRASRNLLPASILEP